MSTSARSTFAHSSSAAHSAHNTKNTGTNGMQIIDTPFVQSLVLAIAGVDLGLVDPGRQLLLAEECMDIYIDFITNYIAVHYSLSDSIRLKAAFGSEQDVFITFPDLKTKYEKAYYAFLEMLEKHIKSLM